MSALQSEKDALRIFVDPAMHVARGGVLRKLAKDAGYGSIKAFTSEVKIGRTQLYQEEIRVKDPLRERLIDLSRIFSNALELFEDESEAYNWLISPNKRFYNMSPFIMAMAGKGKSVFELQEKLLEG